MQDELFKKSVFEIIDINVNDKTTFNLIYWANILKSNSLRQILAILQLDEGKTLQPELSYQSSDLYDHKFISISNFLSIMTFRDSYFLLKLFT